MTFRRNWPYPADTKELADILVRELLLVGFIVQRYDAYSTDSIYLKLDYGVCNSIRISDHKGKKHLSYRYNIGFNVKKPYTENNQYSRYFFPVTDFQKLVTMCRNDKKLKMMSYGSFRYRQYMRSNQLSHLDSKGFWAEAKLAVKRGENIYYES